MIRFLFLQLFIWAGCDVFPGSQTCHNTNKNHRRPGGKFYQLGGNSASEDLVPRLPATDGISMGATQLKKNMGKDGNLHDEITLLGVS